jgi:hypothetical protein
MDKTTHNFQLFDFLVFFGSTPKTILLHPTLPAIQTPRLASSENAQIMLSLLKQAMKKRTMHSEQKPQEE